MPKRSNAFQAAIYQIRKGLTDGTAVVRESHMLRDVVSGKEREVDVTIELEQAGFQILVGIECRDYRRVQSIDFVEEIHSKHQFLPINLSVLVSSSGFTGPARDRAAIYGMKTMTPGELTKDRAIALLETAASLHLYQTEVVFESFRVLVNKCDHHPAMEFQVSEETGLFLGDGQGLGSIMDYAMRSVEKSGGPEAFRSTNTGTFMFTADPVRMRRKGEERFESVYIELRQADEEPHLHEVMRIVVTASAKTDDAPVEMKYGELHGTLYGAGQVKVGDQKVTLVATRRDGGESEVVVRYE